MPNPGWMIFHFYLDFSKIWKNIFGIELQIADNKMNKTLACKLN